MAKINHITIKDVTRYLETIAYLPELPTATEDSADLVSVNNTLYVKQVTDGVYSYGTIQAGGGNVPSGDVIDINVNLEDISLEPALNQGYALTLPLDSTTLAELQTNPRRSIHVHGLVDGEEVIQGAYLYSSDMTIDGSNGSFYGAVDIGFLSLIILETGSDIEVGLELMLSPNLREYLIFNDSDPDEPHLGILAFIGDDSSSVEANPTDTPTETLSTIKINDTIYSLPSGGTGTGGSSVVVNSSDEATGTLTKLTVDGVTYGVPVVEIEDLTSL